MNLTTSDKIIELAKAIGKDIKLLTENQGNLNDLLTHNKSNLVLSINEIHALLTEIQHNTNNVGNSNIDFDSLYTASKLQVYMNLTENITKVVTHIGSDIKDITNQIGNTSLLTTDTKLNLVDAINEVDKNTALNAGQNINILPNNIVATNNDVSFTLRDSKLIFDD